MRGGVGQGLNALKSRPERWSGNKPAKQFAEGVDSSTCGKALYRNRPHPLKSQSPRVEFGFGAGRLFRIHHSHYYENRLGWLNGGLKLNHVAEPFQSP